MFIKKMEDDKEKVDKIFKIVGIYNSNSTLKDGLKIKRSRSCRPNTFQVHSLCFNCNTVKKRLLFFNEKKNSERFG